MRFIVTILTTTVSRFDEMISSLTGFIMACAIVVVNCLVGYKFALVVVLASVLLDMVWGIAAARKQGKFTLSELGRDTVCKIGAYGTALLMAILIENLLTGSHVLAEDAGGDVRWAVDIIASIIAAVEAWSICGNILIVRPNIVFFKLIRTPLIGEVARKLHISEDEVKEIFDNHGSFEKIHANKEKTNNQNKE